MSLVGPRLEMIGKNLQLPRLTNNQGVSSKVVVSRYVYPRRGKSPANDVFGLTPIVSHVRVTKQCSPVLRLHSTVKW